MKINIVIISFKLNFLPDLPIDNKIFIIHLEKTEQQVKKLQSEKDLSHFHIKKRKNHGLILNDVLMYNKYPEILNCQQILFIDHDVVIRNRQKCIDHILLINSKISKKHHILKKRKFYVYQNGSMEFL